MLTNKVTLFISVLVNMDLSLSITPPSFCCGCLEERDLGSIQGPGWYGAKAGACTEIPVEVTSLYHVGRV